MSPEAGNRQVVVLAPMPLEMDAITTAFGLRPTSDAAGAPWTGRVGASDVTAIHIGMGPPLTRQATAQLFDDPAADRPDHVMIAGICGGVDPDLDVGTLLNPEIIVDATSGTEYRHAPPGDVPLDGKLLTTEGLHLDLELSARLRADGFLAVEMESAAVAEVCEDRGCEWSVYRCIGDRPFDGLLDDRVWAMTNPDGSGNPEALRRLLAEDPELGPKLERLARETAMAARLAAEAAVRGCLALDA